METKKLFIVGNGLDLSLGLKTRYSDFIIWYIKDCIQEIILKGTYTTPGLISTLKLNHTIRGNRKYYYKSEFIGQIELFLRSYSDYKTINEVILGLNSYELTLTGSDFFKIILDQSLWSDIEHAYFDLLFKYYQNTMRDKINGTPINHNLVYNLNIEFDNLKKALNDYITLESKKIPTLSKSKNYFNSMNLKLKGNTSNHEILCLNFNYTNTFEKCYFETHKVKLETINIHGSILKDEPIIFGYGDDTDSNYSLIEDFNQDEYLRHFKSNMYSQNSNYTQLLYFIDNIQEIDVFIIGHSCGLSDRTMLKTIFESKRCRTINIFHYKDGAKALEAHMYKDINISRHFTDKLLKRKRLRSYNPEFKIE